MWAFQTVWRARGDLLHGMMLKPKHLVLSCPHYSWPTNACSSWNNVIWGKEHRVYRPLRKRKTTVLWILLLGKTELLQEVRLSITDTIQQSSEISSMWGCNYDGDFKVWMLPVAPSKPHLEKPLPPSLPTTYRWRQSGTSLSLSSWGPQKSPSPARSL